MYFEDALSGSANSHGGLLNAHTSMHSSTEPSSKSFLPQ